MRFIVLIKSICIFLIATESLASATECRKRPILQSRPALAGHAEDQENGTAISWHSVAGLNSTSGGWEIDDAVCNNGSARLMVTWVKAGLSNAGRQPLSSGAELYNHLEIGPVEPSQEHGPLQYGGPLLTTTDAQIYTIPQTGPKVQNTLSSSIGVIAPSLGDTRPVASTSASADITITVYNKGFGFELRTEVHSPRAEHLQVAMHTSHNELLVSMFEFNRLKSYLVPSLEKMVGPLPKGLSALGGLEYVVFPAALPNPIFVKVPIRGAEVVPVVVIDGSEPILVGRASIFR